MTENRRESPAQTAQPMQTNRRLDGLDLPKAASDAMQAGAQARAEPRPRRFGFDGRWSKLNRPSSVARRIASFSKSRLQ